jgi:ribonuclease HI
MTIRPFAKKSGFSRREYAGSSIHGSPDSYLVAYIGGVARGNPGPAAFAVIFEDEIEQPFAHISEFLGQRTAAYAEYAALLAAISYARKHGFKTLKVATDSSTLVGQLLRAQFQSAEFAAREPYSRKTDLLPRLDYFDIICVPGADLSEARQLAETTVDRASRGSSSPGSSLNWNDITDTRPW